MNDNSEFYVSLYDTDFSSLATNSEKLDSAMAIMCLGGNAEIEINTVRYRLQIFDLLLLLPGWMMTLHHCSEDFSMCRFSCSPDMWDQAVYNVPSVFMRFISGKAVNSLSYDQMRTIMNEYFKVMYNKFIDTGNIFRKEIVMNLLRNFYMDTYDKIMRGQGIDFDSTHIKHSRRLSDQFINMLFSTPQCRDVAYYAEKLCITPKYLSIVVNQNTGLSAKQFINKHVINEIKHRLRSDISIQELAISLNFPSTSAFCRYFKKQTGLTVSQFRNYDRQSTAQHSEQRKRKQ